MCLLSLCCRTKMSSWFKTSTSGEYLQCFQFCILPHPPNTSLTVLVWCLRILLSLWLLSTEAPHTFVSNPLQHILSCSPPRHCKSAYFQARVKWSNTLEYFPYPLLCCTENTHTMEYDSYTEDEKYLGQPILSSYTNSALHTFMPRHLLLHWSRNLCRILLYGNPYHQTVMQEQIVFCLIMIFL